MLTTATKTNLGEDYYDLQFQLMLKAGFASSTGNAAKRLDVTYMLKKESYKVQVALGLSAAHGNSPRLSGTQKLDWEVSS